MSDTQIYCLKCRTHTDNTDLVLRTTKNGKLQQYCKCSVCGSGKCRFIKKIEGDGLIEKLSKGKIKLPDSIRNIPIIGDIASIIV